MTDLTEGAHAPSLDLPTDGGGRISLASLKGRPVVVFFYPKADTPGCTNEAIDFSGLLPDFEAADATVIGVSRDPVKKLDRFKAKHDLNFTLGSDEDGKVCEAYGTWIEKSMYGRKYMGIDRATFLIDGKVTIRNIWRKVKVPGHVDEVLEAAKAL